MKLEKEYSQDFEIMQIVCNELKLATLLELQTQYSVSDLYDLMEIQEAYSLIIDEQKDKN